MIAEIRGRQFEYCDQVLTSEQLIRSFNALTQETYGFDFAQWHQNGHWGARYQPHVLALNGRVVANVSLNRMEMMIRGKKVSLAQIGTVMTAPEFRRQGLSAFLMRRVIECARQEERAVFLFANDSVLDFYPRFGFCPGTETQRVIPLPEGGLEKGRRLDMRLGENRRRVLELYRSGEQASELYELDNPGLMMFYLEGFLSECVYELPGGALAVAEQQGETLWLHAVLSGERIELREAARQLADRQTRRVYLGFSPEQKEGFCPQPFKEEDSTLFWLDGQAPEGFEGLRIPQLSHA